MDATYLDISGSMYHFDPHGKVLSYHAAGSPAFYFDTEVHEEKPDSGTGTDFGAVFEHARASGFQSIRIITDGYADGFKSQPSGLSVDWVQYTP